MPLSNPSVTAPSPIFFPAGLVGGNGTHLIGKNRPVTILDANGEYCYIGASIPLSFNALIDALIVISFSNPVTTPTLDWSVETNYGGVGELGSLHVGNATQNGLAIPDMKLIEIDISAALADLAAGDYLGIKFTADVLTDLGYIQIQGFQLRYS